MPAQAPPLSAGFNLVYWKCPALYQEHPSCGRGVLVEGGCGWKGVVAAPPITILRLVSDFSSGVFSAFMEMSWGDDAAERRSDGRAALGANAWHEDTAIRTRIENRNMVAGLLSFPWKTNFFSLLKLP